MNSSAGMSADQQKYVHEAAKRTRLDGSKQYQDLHHSDNDRLRSLVDDFWADHEMLDKLPSPITIGGRIKFLILGAGIGGIISAVRLVQAGFAPDQIVIVEIGGGIGGTWYWNRYPGLHCDVEAYVYMPLLEETGYMPMHKYASGVEIRHYLVKLVERFGLSKRVLFRTQVTGLHWNYGTQMWRTDMTASRGPDGKAKEAMWVSAEFPILVSGLFPYPHVPKIPGLADFEGDMFHTSRWNYDLTGGSSDSPYPHMRNLASKRVGVIGTGATAIQIVPELAKYAKELYVFQRTPSQVFLRRQQETDIGRWIEDITASPGWQKERMENLAEHLNGEASPNSPNLVDDAWSKLKAYCAVLGSSQFGMITPDKIPEHIAKLQEMDADDTLQARKRISRIVRDKDTAEQLMPWYFTWCKRPTFSDFYLQAFNEPHVHLVDTDGKGIDSLSARGVVASGKEHPVDILIMATGYRSPGIDIIGRNKLSFSAKVAAKGASTLHGCCTHDFPNLFFVGPAQTAATASYSHALDVLCRHVAYIIAEAHKDIEPRSRKRHVVIEPTEVAEEAYAAKILEGAAFYSTLAVCTPNYVTLEGEATRPAEQAETIKRARSSMWYQGILSFERMLEAWRADRRMEGLEVTIISE
jgi:cation diffusion facilitator CzcD-associated flavoprotein CzcO